MIEFFKENWAVIKSAPLPFIIFILIALPSICFFFWSFFKERIEGYKDIQANLEKKLAASQQEIIKLQAQIFELQKQNSELQVQNEEALLKQTELEDENSKLKGNKPKIVIVKPRYYPEGRH